MLINTDTMLEYLGNFRYIEKKYGIMPQEENLSKVYAYESCEQKSRLQTIPPNYIEKTIEKVYSFSPNSRIKSTKLFSIVRNEFINKFLNVAGLELLFNEHYFDFEWDMHWGINFEKTASNYYRDHFEHQIRNMYVMLVLLDDFDMISDIEKMHLDESLSKVSEYVSKRFKEYCKKQSYQSECYEVWKACAQEFYLNQMNDKMNTIENIINSLCDYCAEYKIIDRNKYYNRINEYIDSKGGIDFTSNTSANSPTNIIKLLLEELDLIKMYFEKHSMRYILRSAAIMATLFHDVSYPLCHFRKMQDRTSEYLPSMHPFIHNNGINFDKIISNIQRSLLCMLVSPKEIKKGLEADADGEYDHGIYSAVTFLLSFYDGGRINDLSLDKQLAVEIAALAIYNHNFGYILTKDSKMSEKHSYFRPIFTQNPISYLLKLCDELQEWDRKYFELSDKEDYFFCKKCNYPIIKYRLNSSEYEWRTKYICGCTNPSNTKAAFFPRREMHIVTTCKSLEIKNINGNLVININYDPLRLLKMAEMDSGYAKFRIKALSKLKKILLNQKYFYDSDTEINKNSQNDRSTDRIVNIYIDYIMSANPLYLKAKIIQNYVFPCEKRIGLCADATLLTDIRNKLNSYFTDNISLSKINCKKNSNHTYEELANKITKYKLKTVAYDIKILNVFDALIIKRFNDNIQKNLETFIINNEKMSSNDLLIKTKILKFSNNLSDALKNDFLSYLSTSLSNGILNKNLTFSFESINNITDKCTNFVNKISKLVNGTQEYQQSVEKNLLDSLISSLIKESLYIAGEIILNIAYVINCDENCISQFVKSANDLIESKKINVSNIPDDKIDASNCFVDQINKHLCSGYSNVLISIMRCCAIVENNKYLSKKSIEKTVSVSGFRAYLKNINKRLSFYNELAYYITLSEFEIYKGKADVLIKNFLKLAIDKNEKDDIFKNVLNDMLKDVFNVISDTIGQKIDLSTVQRERNYLNKYKMNDKLVQSIEMYTNPLNWYGDGSGYKNFSEKCLDFHSDLYLFELLGGTDNNV